MGYKILFTFCAWQFLGKYPIIIYVLHLENFNFGPALIKRQKGKLDFLKKLMMDFLSVWLRQVMGHPVIIWHWNQLTHSHSNLIWETWSISDPLLPRHHIYEYIILIIWVTLVALIDSGWLLKTIPDPSINVQIGIKHILSNLAIWKTLNLDQPW